MKNNIKRFKNIFQKIVFFMLFILIFSANIYSQENIVRQSGKAVIINEKYKDNSLLKEAINWPYLSIKPLGWSKKGLFAYLYMTNYISGAQGVEFVVFDAVEDRLFDQVEIKTWVSQEVFLRDKIEISRKKKELDNGLKNGNLAKSSIKNWNNSLKENEINGQIDELNTSYIIPLEFPFTIDNKTYDCWIESSINKTENTKLGPWPTTWKLIVSNGVKQKVISSNEEYTDINNNYLGSAIKGYFISPYERRIIVAVNHYEVRDDGELNEKLDFHGCHLDIGF